MPESIEQEIQRKGLTAPRVTPERLEEVIASEQYFNVGEALKAGEMARGVHEPKIAAPLFLLTICVLTLRNGFTVIGESACASPENFNREVGHRRAREKAIEKIWPLEGYLLREYLSHQAAG